MRFQLHRQEALRRHQRRAALGAAALGLRDQAVHSFWCQLRVTAEWENKQFGGQQPRCQVLMQKVDHVRQQRPEAVQARRALW